jgi:hypothetical protein
MLFDSIRLTVWYPGMEPKMHFILACNSLCKLLDCSQIFDRFVTSTSTDR